MKHTIIILLLLICKIAQGQKGVSILAGANLAAPMHWHFSDMLDSKESVVYRFEVLSIFEREKRNFYVGISYAAYRSGFVDYSPTSGCDLISINTIDQRGSFWTYDLGYRYIGVSAGLIKELRIKNNTRFTSSAGFETRVPIASSGTGQFTECRMLNLTSVSEELEKTNVQIFYNTKLYYRIFELDHLSIHISGNIGIGLNKMRIGGLSAFENSSKSRVILYGLQLSTLF